MAKFLVQDSFFGTFFGQFEKMHHTFWKKATFITRLFSVGEIWCLQKVHNICNHFDVSVPRNVIRTIFVWIECHCFEKTNVVEGLGTLLWNKVHYDFLPKWMIFFHFPFWWFKWSLHKKNTFSFDTWDKNKTLSIT